MENQIYNCEFLSNFLLVKILINNGIIGLKTANIILGVNLCVSIGSQVMGLVDIDNNLYVCGAAYYMWTFSKVFDSLTYVLANVKSIICRYNDIIILDMNNHLYCYSFDGKYSHIMYNVKYIEKSNYHWGFNAITYNNEFYSDYDFNIPDEKYNR